MRGGPAPDLDTLRRGGKAAVARALAALETEGGIGRWAAFLDDCVAAPGGHVLGLTGPPGVGKSTLTNTLLRRARDAGRTVGVIAVDPSSRVTGGALLGDRTRLKTDPDDTGIFVRSMAARDRLGGLSDHAIAAVQLMRAVYDQVIVESVGIGQSEADVAMVADTIVLCIQPGSGDSLQFMKAGVMEIPDVVVVTKADTGPAARRAVADVEGALSLSVRDHGSWKPPVIAISSVSGEGLDALAAAVDAHRLHAAEADRATRTAAARRRHWVVDAVRSAHGSRGLARVDIDRALTEGGGPFRAMVRLLGDLEGRAVAE